MAGVALKSVYKKYDSAENYSATNFNLSIKDCEFIVFVSPSDCGKSTTLRMIVGLEDISEGELNTGGKAMNDVALEGCSIAMVLQNYASYPHMTVFDNMALGLKLREYNKADIKKRMDNVAEILGLTEYLKRKPAALSDGQRQYVALRRAVVRDAKVSLMNESLSNLNTELRVTMCAEIIKLRQCLETTTIYVTHDQTKAMTIADRIIIMKDGSIQQIGTPKEVYDAPVNIFVAGFIGPPAMNFSNMALKGGIITDGHGSRLRIPEGRNKVLVEKGHEGKEVIFDIRPKDIHSKQVALEASPRAIMKSEVVVSELLGVETMPYTKTGLTEFISKVDARDFHEPGEIVGLVFNISKGHLFDKETE